MMGGKRRRRSVMNSAVESVKKILLTMLLALGVGAIIILVNWTKSYRSICGFDKKEHLWEKEHLAQLWQV